MRTSQSSTPLAVSRSATLESPPDIVDLQCSKWSLGDHWPATEGKHLPLLTVYGPIARAMASKSEARHQPHQGHAANQRGPAQSVCLGLLVLQLSRMLDSVGDEMMRFCTQQDTWAHPHLNCMASGKDARSRAGADAASAEHSMQTGLELREQSSAQSLTDGRSDATSDPNSCCRKGYIGVQSISAMVTGLQLLQDNWIDLTDIALGHKFRSVSAQHLAAQCSKSTMAHSMAGFLGTARQVPTCILNASQPVHRAAAPQPQTPLRTCQHLRGRTQQRQQALQAWILHAVRSDQQGSQVDSSTLQLISDLTNKVDQEHAAILAENSQALEGIVEDAAADSLKRKVEQSIQKLQKGLLERETEVRPQDAFDHAAAMN